MWPGYADHMGWMALWWIVGLAVLAAFVWAVARMSGTPGATPGQESPELILKSRYARGEIDREEYERRLADIRK